MVSMTFEPRNNPGVALEGSFIEAFDIVVNEKGGERGVRWREDFKTGKLTKGVADWRLGHRTHTHLHGTHKQRGRGGPRKNKQTSK